MRTYTLEIFDTEYTYRGLTRGEALGVLRQPIPEWDREQKIVDIAVLGCKVPSKLLAGAVTQIPGDLIEWHNTLAGVVTRLAIAIGEVSGISESGAAKFNEEVQAWIATPAGRTEMLMMGICGLTITQIHAFDPVDWFYHAAAAQTLYDLQNEPQKARQPLPSSAPPEAHSPRKNQMRVVPEQNVMINSSD